MLRRHLEEFFVVNTQTVKIPSLLKHKITITFGDKKMNNKISNIANGTFTLINREKGSHITMKIHTVKDGDLKGKRIISKLIGPDNTTSFQGIAFLNKKDTYSLWKKHRTIQNGSIISILLAMLTASVLNVLKRVCYFNKTGAV